MKNSNSRWTKFSRRVSALSIMAALSPLPYMQGQANAEGCVTDANSAYEECIAHGADDWYYSYGLVIMCGGRLAASVADACYKTPQASQTQALSLPQPICLTQALSLPQPGVTDGLTNPTRVWSILRFPSAVLL